MDENPYQSPIAETMPPAVGVKSGRREDLRSVAVYQKGILVCILLYFAAVGGQFFIPPELQLLLVLGVLGVGITGFVFVILLAAKVYDTALGILLGILTVIPLIGLFILLNVSRKATQILQQNGHKVGLLGADLSEF